MMSGENEAGPQIKRREVWVDLPDEYEGFRFKLWVNAPTKIWNTITSGADEETIQGSLRQLILEHNGWLNFDGLSYSAPNTAEFWEEIPTELAACLVVASQAEMQMLPNSIASRRRRSKRG
ncbi:MAG: hypothetical protein GY805_05025 [Chloroflexi bacterium]|nr:hypothetical protein [Chloroflexota bacterium]